MKKQAGFVMPQLAMAVAILSMMIIWGMKVYSEQAINKSRDEAARLLGNRLGLVGDAGKTYATTFFTAIQKSQDATYNGYTVPAVRVRNPTLPDLVGLGFLRSEAASDVRLANQTIGIGVQYTVDTTGCTVPNCNVAFQATTTAPLLDAATGAVDVRRIQLAATTASPGNAGSALPESPGQFVGLGGNVIGPNTTGTAGLIALRNGYDAQGMAEFLRRDGTLPMTGDLNMGSNNVTMGGSADFTSIRATTGDITAEAGNIVATAGNVKGQTFVPTLLVAENSSCTGYEAGAIAIKNDGSGTTLGCQYGIWKKIGGGDFRMLSSPVSLPVSGEVNLALYAPSGAKTVMLQGYAVNNWARTFNDELIRVGGVTMCSQRAAGQMNYISCSMVFPVATYKIEVLASNDGGGWFTNGSLSIVGYGT